MVFKSKKKYTTLAIAAALSLGSITTANAASVTIENPGFEDKFEGWSDTDPSAISSDEYSGSRSAKITGSGGRFEQDVSVEQNTNYILSAYIDGSGTIGVDVNGSVSSTTGGEDGYAEVTVSFNSGSATTLTIFGAFGDDDGRFDDFTLTSTGTEEPEEETPVEEVPEEENPEETPTTCTGASNLLIASASDNGTNDGHGPENTIDGDTSDESRWSSNGSGKEITFDLGSEASVQKLEIQWFKGNSRNSYFDIDTSTDNSNWTSVLSNGSSDGGSSDAETIDVDDSNARYVRVTGLGNSSNTWNSIIEARVLGCDSAEETPVEEVPEEETPEEETPVEEIPAGDAEYPSDLMRNFDQWKITFPDGEEVKQLENVSNEYYYVNEEQNGIVFFAPVRSSNGTTPNSSYIRSELRERTEDGSSDIYWTTDGTHVVYAKQAITHLPIVKNHLVATQIHGDKESGIDDALVLRLEGEHLFLSFNGGKLREDVTVKTDYKLGAVHEVMFEVIDGKHYVYYSEDGKLNSAYAAGDASQYLVKDGSNDYVMDLNYDESYFKIGNYTQSNAEKEGDYTDDSENYGEVVVYDFWVNHE